MLKKLFEFIKFSIVGVLMTLLSLALFYVFIEIFDINYILSNIYSYSIAVIVSYFLNSIFTFKLKNQNKKNHIKNLINYFIMKLILLGMDSLLLYVLVDISKWNVYVSKIFLTVLFFIISYPISKFIIERNMKDDKGNNKAVAR